VLFDRPHAIEQASAAAFDRLTLQAGDFFTDDPVSQSIAESWRSGAVKGLERQFAGFVPQRAASVR
jgi:hypothetical protein